MDSVAEDNPTSVGSGHWVRDLGISEFRARFIPGRSGVMTIYRAASVIG